MKKELLYDSSFFAKGSLAVHSIDKEKVEWYYMYRNVRNKRRHKNRLLVLPLSWSITGILSGAIFIK
jgi:hypothetical protein